MGVVQNAVQHRGGERGVAGERFVPPEAPDEVRTSTLLGVVVAVAEPQRPEATSTMENVPIVAWVSNYRDVHI